MVLGHYLLVDSHYLLCLWANTPKGTTGMIFPSGVFYRATMAEAVQNHVRSLNWGHRVQLQDKWVTPALLAFIQAMFHLTVDLNAGIMGDAPPFWMWGLVQLASLQWRIFVCDYSPNVVILPKINLSILVNLVIFHQNVGIFIFRSVFSDMK